MEVGVRDPEWIPNQGGPTQCAQGTTLRKPIVGFHKSTNRSKLRAKASWLFHLDFSALYFWFFGVFKLFYQRRE